MAAYVYYNITNMTAVGNNSNILTFVSTVNDTLNGVPSLLMLIAITIVLFTILIGKGVDVFRSFAATSFASMIFAIILYPMSLISGSTLIIFCVIFPVSMFLLWVFGGESV